MQVFVKDYAVSALAFCRIERFIGSLDERLSIFLPVGVGNRDTQTNSDRDFKRREEDRLFANAQTYAFGDRAHGM